jgi:CRP-like cAMP-binding protein
VARGLHAPTQQESSRVVSVGVGERLCDPSVALTRARVKESSRVREVDFIVRLQELVDSPVSGLDADAKARMLLAASERVRHGDAGLECRVVPFVPGWRPIDEALHPGLGSSDPAALVLAHNGPRQIENVAYVLFDIGDRVGRPLELDVTLSFVRRDASSESILIPGWDRRPVRAMAFDGGAGRQVVLRDADLRLGGVERIALVFLPEVDLLPGKGWSWEQLDKTLRDAATDAEDPYTFGHLFAQHVRVELRVTEGGVPVAGAEARLLVCDASRFGSLYERLVERLVAPDTTRQASACGVPDPGAAFHPWYPVLEIGGNKAELYKRALIADIVDKRRNLTDPCWLLQVGLYLEFLTFLGVAEAVRDDHGDLLTPSERLAFARSPWFAQIRDRINPTRWREVWKLHRIAFPARGVPRTGPVSARNLLGKRRATLAFLEAHHDDLKHAIELAGPNHHNAQETWQRVFRDAERAVLRMTPAAFPELGFLPAQVREFVLWHKRGQLGLERSLRVPTPMTRLLGDHDGLFASACTQYRGSMNAVAAWSKERLLIDFTGDECIPREASLLETRIARPAQVALLQRRDGYEEGLDLPVELPVEYERSTEDLSRLLHDVPIFASLTSDERLELVRTARQVRLGPLERLVVQGQVGTSLFVVAEGAVEVLLRREDGRDWPLDTRVRGSVIGEMSLLTGAPRAATVRAVTGATVYEIGKRQYEPLLRRRPELLDELAAIVEQRLRQQAERLHTYDADRERKAIRDRINRFMNSG